VIFSFPLSSTPWEELLSKASASRGENCTLIIRHLTALASSASVIQMDKYKKITGFDVHSVKTFNDLMRLLT